MTGTIKSVLLPCAFMLSEAFTIKHCIQNCATGVSISHLAFSQSAVDAEAPDLDNPRGVHRVSICMGELCKCQEENSDFIMNDLLSRNLPYTVEDSPCLGSCGVGSVVSIEYNDGGYDLVTGLQETHDAVGIIPSSRIDEQIELLCPPTLDHEEEETNEKGGLGSTFVVSSKGHEREDDMKQEIKSADERNSDLPDNSLPAGKEPDHGAVERMRIEAEAANEENPNPWVNMAFYLAKKAKENIIG